MPKTAAIALGAAFAALFAGLAGSAPPAAAETPECKNRPNKYVACTHERRANPRDTARRGKVEHEWKVEEGEASKRKPWLK